MFEVSFTRPQFVYEHVWRVGDLVMWDNRCTIHRRDAFDSGERRIMWRTQVKDTSNIALDTAALNNTILATS